MKIELKTPIVIDGDVVNFIEVNETNITVKMLIDMQAPIMEKDLRTGETMWRPRTQIEQALVIVKYATQATESELSKMSGEDFFTIVEELTPFLDSQGETSKSK